MNTQLHTIYTEITVTPEAARQMLNNCHSEQRNVNQRRVDLYAREMASGNWHEPPYTFDSIAVDENGKLVNGQHRLLAVVKANVTVRFNLLQGVRTPQGLILPAGDIGLARHGAFVTGMSVSYTHLTLPTSDLV